MPPTDSKVQTARLNLRWSIHLMVFSILTFAFLLLIGWITLYYSKSQYVNILMVVLEIGLLCYGASHAFGGKDIIAKLKRSDKYIYTGFILFTIFFGLSFTVVISFNDYYFFNTLDFDSAQSFLVFLDKVISYSFNDLVNLIFEGNRSIADYLRIAIAALFGLITVFDISFIAKLKRNDDDKLYLGYYNYLIGDYDRSKYWLKKIRDKKNTQSYDVVNAYLNLQTDFDKALIYTENTLEYADVRNEETVYLRLYTIVMNLGKEVEKTAYIKFLKEEMPDSIYIIIVEMLNMDRYDYKIPFDSFVRRFENLLKNRDAECNDPFFVIYLAFCKMIFDMNEIQNFQSVVIQNLSFQQLTSIVYNKYGSNLSKSQFLFHLKNIKDFDRLSSQDQKKFKKSWDKLRRSSGVCKEQLDFKVNLVSPLHQTFLKKLFVNVLAHIKMLSESNLYKERITNEMSAEDFLKVLHLEINSKKTN
ncbi:hypothetical protein JCM19297_309 [Nonlabens ulvanivorans]|nr:hypothetical protein JCM19297_309 [Nonlabens ulvanivorans]